MKINVITLFGFYTIKQDEVGVVLNFGSFGKTVGPGLGFAIPIIQSVIKTPGSVQTLDLPDQNIVLHGNISVRISGSVNFRVGNAKRAILEVNDYSYSLRQLALTTISDVLGTKSIEEVRGGKQKIADEIEQIVAKTASKWGLQDVDIRLTDAEMDDKLLRAMMRETEAEKEAKAIAIKAESDRNVAQTFAEAANTLAGQPGAMTLRILQTLSDMSNSKSTVVVPIPIELMSLLNSGAGQKTAAPAGPPPVKTLPKVAKAKHTPEGYKANCPSCFQLYKVDKVLGNEKYDEDDTIPGIQLKCKKCKELFTLES